MFKWIKKRLLTLSIFEIFISISIIVLTVFVVKFFGQKLESKTVRIEIVNHSWTEYYDLYGYRAPFWLSEKLKIGQKEYDKSGKVIAEIINIENYERGSEEAEIYLTVKLRTTYQKSLHQSFFKEKPLSLGSAIEISPDQNIVFGQVVDVNVPIGGYPENTFIITTRAREVDKYLINNTRVDDTMYNRYTNEPVATIISFKTEYTSRITDSSHYSYLQTGQKSTAQDVILKLKIKTHQIDNRWYFGGHQQIKVGNTFYFYGQQVNYYPMVIENVENVK
jgi:hypothetical protein